MTGQIITVRGRLRSATRAAHEALEAALPLSRKAVDERSYRDHVRFMLSVHLPLERGLAAVERLDDWVPDLAARRRVPALREDLADDLADPAPAPLAVPDDVAGSLGVLYVLEGSTLGARSLLPRLRRAGTIPGRVGHRYLEGYGDATAIRWHAFCAALERLDSAAAERAEHCAQRTFTDILDWRQNWDSVS